MRELSLTQAIKAGLLESIFKQKTGQVIDRETGLAKPMENAIKEGLVDRRSSAVYDPRKGRRISIEEAISSGKAMKWCHHFGRTIYFLFKLGVILSCQGFC